MKGHLFFQPAIILTVPYCHLLARQPSCIAFPLLLRTTLLFFPHLPAHAWAQLLEEVLPCPPPCADIPTRALCPYWRYLVCLKTGALVSLFFFLCSIFIPPSCILIFIFKKWENTFAKPFV